MIHHIADIRDLGRIQALCDELQPEIVFHLAAQSLVRTSYEDPIATYATNTMGTVNVLEACRHTSSVRACVVITTDKVYENREWLWAYRENDALGGRDPYSSSKACAELVTEAYRMSFLDKRGVAVASARAGNVIGGGDWARDRIVPDAMRAFIAKQPLVLRNPASIRPWQHVLEPLAGYLDLAERLVDAPREFANAWNFGPSDDQVYTVGELAGQLVRAWGAGAEWKTVEQVNAPHEAQLLHLDAAKARTRLHWRPRLSTETTVRWIVDWHKDVAEGADARALTLQQIDAYSTKEHL